MDDWETPALSPAFQSAWEKANRIGDEKKRNEQRSILLSDISRDHAFMLLFKRELTLREIEDYGLFDSVTNKVSSTKKPGRFVKPSAFEKIQLEGGGIEDLHPVENIYPGLIGIAVDYLTRLMTGDSPDSAFSVSLNGSDKVNARKQAEALIESVKGLEDDSICSAIRLAVFDTVYRAGEAAYIPVETIYPDADTVENVRNMVWRSVAFLDIYGPKITDHLTFKGGYTGHVTSGDGDFLTKDTLWDFKVSKQTLQSRSVLQLLIYWRLGLHSIHPEYRDVKYLGVYNPRMNMIYRYPVADISDEAIEELDYSIICYPRE